MEPQVVSRIISLKNEKGVSERRLNEIINEALLNFGERCLVSYAKSYTDNPKAFISSFLKYDSIKMACEYSIKYARISGMLKELEGKKDFTDYVNKLTLEEKWKPVLNKFLLILWGVLK